MGAGHFDAFARALPDLLSRRSALTGVVGTALATLVTHRYALGDLGAAYAQAGDKRGGAVKVVVRTRS